MTQNKLGTQSTFIRWVSQRTILSYSGTAWVVGLRQTQCRYGVLWSLPTGLLGSAPAAVYQALSRGSHVIQIRATWPGCGFLGSGPRGKTGKTITHLSVIARLKKRQDLDLKAQGHLMTTSLWNQVSPPAKPLCVQHVSQKILRTACYEPPSSPQSVML